MDYNKATGLRTFAYVCLAMILLETVTAAPVLDSSNTGSTIRRTRSTKPSHLRRKAGDVRKHEHLRWYGILNATDWSNPCHSAGNVEVTSEVSAPPTTNFTEPTEVKTVIQQLNQTLWAFEAQNTTLWEHFHQQNYTFLPVKPGRNAYKWHEHTQVYVATLSVIHHMQLKKDNESNNITVSSEIREVFERAQELLCTIEHFINKTSNGNQGRKLVWITKRNMAEKINSLPKKKYNISNAFVKDRFAVYLKKLYQNVKNYHPETKSQKQKRRKTRVPTRRPNCTPRPGKGCRKRRTTVEPTKPMHIFRTTRPRNQNRQRKNQKVE